MAALIRAVVDILTFTRDVLVNPETGKPFELYPAQAQFLREAFRLTPDGRLLYPDPVYGAIKKSGKTTMAGIGVNYVGAVLSPWYGEIFVAANDLEQAVGRVFQAAARIAEASPMLRGETRVTAQRIEYKRTSSVAFAVANDYAGIAGVDPVFRRARVLREARFVPIDPDADAEATELRLLREETMRQRLREDLRDAPVEELAATIVEAGATQNLALLHLAEGVLARRKRAGESVEVLAPATSALVDAKERIEAPTDVQRLEARFSEIEAMKRDIDAVIPELATGRQGADVAEKVRRVGELAAEGMPSRDIAMQVSSEQSAARAARKQRAARRADQILTEAIQLDEEDAAALAVVPIGHNPNPSAA